MLYRVGQHPLQHSTVYAYRASATRGVLWIRDKKAQHAHPGRNRWQPLWLATDGFL